MNPRWHIPEDPRLLEMKGALVNRLTQVVDQLDPTALASLLDPLLRSVFQAGIKEAQADEGTIWLVDRSAEFLEPAHNTGPHAARFVGSFRQPLSEGLICMVFSTEQAFMENEVFRNTRQSKRLDTLLEVRTQALLAVPFTLFNHCRGVVSCVQLGAPDAGQPTPRGFQSANLTTMQRTAMTLSRLLEHRLLGSVLGWTND